MMKVINHAPPARRTTTWTTAAMAAASASANAELVQIDLIGNELLAVGTNGLFADLDGVEPMILSLPAPTISVTPRVSRRRSPPPGLRRAR